MSSTAGGAILWKFGLLAGAVSVLTTVIGFLVMWPRTLKEAAIRGVATFAGSFLLGPFVCIAAYSRWPELWVAGAQLFGQVAGAEYAWAGTFFVAAPFLAFTGLPFWWILGAVILWLERARRRRKDIVQMGAEIKKAVRP